MRAEIALKLESGLREQAKGRQIRKPATPDCEGDSVVQNSAPQKTRDAIAKAAGVRFGYRQDCVPQQAKRRKELVQGFGEVGSAIILAR